jgi:hypothetical protein
MATALFFLKESKNLLIQDRNVREAMTDGNVDFLYVLSKDFDAKPSPAPEFIRKRFTLLNIAAAPHLHKYL